MLEFRQVRSDAQMREVQRIRYEVYCQEKGFLNPCDYPDGLEQDEYDSRSVHFVAVETDDGQEKILGTLRLIKPSSLGFPAARHFSLSRPISNPENTLELSRLIVVKEARRLSVHILMGLSKEVYLYSREQGVSDLYAILEEPLLKLLRRLGLPFNEVGETQWYLNSSNTPVHLSISDAESVLAANNAFFFAYLQAPKEEQAAWF